MKKLSRWSVGETSVSEFPVGVYHCACGPSVIHRLSSFALCWYALVVFSPGCFPALLDLFHDPGIPGITAFTISTSTDPYGHHSVFVNHNCSYHLNALIDYHD